MNESFLNLVRLAETEDTSFADVSREACVASAWEYVQERRKELRLRHEAGESGFNIITQLSEVADTLLKGVFSFGLYHVPKRRALLKRISLCAQGGYGRAQLNPNSDLDVGVLYRGRLDRNLETLNKYLIPFLWDIGYDNSYVVRTVSEAIKLSRQDARVYTSYLQCRLLMGSADPIGKLRIAIQGLRSAEIGDGFEAFVSEDDDESDGAYGAVYAPEPNVKEGVGGLRDYHVGLWLFTATYGASTLDEIEGRGFIESEARLELASALDFLWRVRNELHFMTGKREDRLTHEKALQVARAFGYIDETKPDLSRFFEDYYAAARRVRRFRRTAMRLCAAGTTPGPPEASNREQHDFQVINGELHLEQTDSRWFEENPARMMSLFWECARLDITLSHSAERAIYENLHLVGDSFRSSDLVRRFFVAICNRPYRAGRALRLAAECGLLRLYIPEFADVEDIIRYQDFHRYPVDEHTLRAIEAVSDLSEMEGPIANFLKLALEHLSDPSVLVLALLFHDLGKASGENHSDEGVRLAHIICGRMGMNAENTERIAFLIQHHLLMTNIAMYRDTDDIDVIENFAKVMKSEDRLRALFVLSYADLSAVAPNVWNDWKGTLLLKLYLKTESVLSGRRVDIGEDFLTHPRAEQVRELLSEEEKEGLEKHLRAFGAQYFMAFPASQIVAHMQCLAEAEAEGFALRAQTNKEIGMTEVVVCSLDHRGLFEELAGCFACQLIDVERAALYTRPDGLALDCFTVVNAARKSPLTTAQIRVLERVLRKVIVDHEDVKAMLAKSRQRIYGVLQSPLAVLTRISFDNESSRTFTVIDVESADRMGLLYDITRGLTEYGLDIESARIVTDAGRAHDAFYVTLNNVKIEGDDRQAEIREMLERAIHPRPAVELKHFN